MKKLTGKQIAAIVALVLMIVCWIVPPIAGLTKDAMVFLGIFIWMMIMLAAGSLPNETTTLITLALVLVTKVSSFDVLFKPFAGNTVWLLIAVFGYGVAVANSGLLVRVAMYIMKLFPQTYNGRLLAIMTAGAVITPLIPNLSAKSVIMVPVAGALGDEAGYAPKSKGQAGLFMGAYISAGMLGNAFLTGSLGVPLVLMFVPSKSWFQWFSAMWLWAIICIVGMYFFLRIYYNPKMDEAADKSAGSDALNARIAALGPISKKEIITACVLLTSIVLWMTESMHGLNTFTVTLIGFCVLSLSGLFSTIDFMTKIAWPMIVMIGGVLGVVDVMAEVGINDWIAVYLGPVVTKIAGNPYILVIGLSIGATLLQLVMIGMITDMMIVSAVFAPIAATVGIDIWIPMLVIMLSSQQWVYKPQSSSLLAALGVCGDRVDHSQTIPASVAWSVCNFVACVASIPVWKMIGLIA